jgi:hypothetical protein
MTTLTVPPPELAFDPPGGPPALETPIALRLSGVQYPDGADLRVEDARVIGVLVYRGTAGSEEVWDEALQVWTSPPTDEAELPALKPLPFSPPTGPGLPWTGTFIAAGQKDGTGNPRFSKGEGGTPVYRLRAFAAAARDGVGYQGVSAPTTDLLFVSTTEQQRFAVEFDTGQASDAGRARLFLKNGALQPAGYLEIRATGGQEVEIANCTGFGAALARVTLSADGDIHLVPASGRQIVLEAPLDAQQITYQPQGGGPRQTL